MWDALCVSIANLFLSLTSKRYRDAVDRHRSLV